MAQQAEMYRADTTPRPTARRWPLALRRLLLGLVGALGILFLTIGAFTVFDIPIDLSAMRGWVEQRASGALQRPVRIDGPLLLLPGFTPGIQVHDLSIGVPTGHPKTPLARLRVGRLHLSILPLLRSEVAVERAELEGLELYLQPGQAGDPLWPSGAASTTAQPSSHWRLVELSGATVRDVTLVHQRSNSIAPTATQIDTITLAAAPGQALQLSLRGRAESHPYWAELSGGTLTELLDGDQPWPLEVVAQLAGAELRAAAVLFDADAKHGPEIDVDLRIPSTAELNQVFAAALPFDQLALSGSLHIDGHHYRLDALTGTLDDIPLSGGLAVDLSGPRPRLSGTLDTPLFDAGRLFSSTDDSIPDSLGASEPVPKPVPELAPPRGIDADIQLNIAEVAGAPASLSDLAVDLTLRDDAIHARLTARLAGEPITGDIALTRSDGVPSMRLSLEARDSSTRHLANWLLDVEGVEGRIARAKLDLAARGNTLDDWVDSASLRFALADATLSYGNDGPDGDSKPVEFKLARFDLAFPAHRPARIEADGALLGEPFTLQLQGGTFRDKFITGNWAFELTASGGGAQLHAKTRVDPSVGAETRFALHGERIGDLQRWLGVAPDASAAYRLEGDLVLDSTGWLATVTDGRVDNSRFTAEIGERMGDADSVTRLVLDTDVVDLARLGMLVPGGEPRQPPKNRRMQYTIDLPILPGDIELIDSDLDLSVGRLKTRALTLHRLRVNAEVRDGHIRRAPIAFATAGATLQGHLSADLRDESPRVGLRLNARAMDVGKLLQQTRVIEGVELSAGRFALSADIEGASLRQMVRRSKVTLRIHDGLWRLQDSGLQGSLDLAIAEATLEARGRRPTRITLDGQLEQLPLQLTLETDPLSGLAGPMNSLGIDTNIKLAEAELQLSGDLPVPIRGNQLRFDLALNGRRLSDLDPLFTVSLPPLGAIPAARAFRDDDARLQHSRPAYPGRQQRPEWKPEPEHRSQPTAAAHETSGRHTPTG